MANSENSTPRQPTVAERRLRVAALTVLQDRVKTALTDARADLEATMTNGESHTVWSPVRDGAQIATVNRSKPKPAARVTDRAALAAWLEAHQPDAVQTTRHATAEGLDFLGDAAPELLEHRRVVPDWAVEAVLKASAEARTPCHPDGTTGVPGVAVDPAPPGRLSIRLAAEAADLVTELVERGVVDLQGTPLAIEAQTDTEGDDCDR